jgi:hypothetical protein
MTYFKKYIKTITYCIDIDQSKLTCYICDPGYEIMINYMRIDMMWPG